MNADDRNGADVGTVRSAGGADVQDLLSDPHVRHLLGYLRDADGPVALETAATHVAARITDTPPEEVPDDVRNRIQTFLHHGHLPELAADDFIEYDTETNTIVLER